MFVRWINKFIELKDRFQHMGSVLCTAGNTVFIGYLPAEKNGVQSHEPCYNAAKMSTKNLNDTKLLEDMIDSNEIGAFCIQ